MTFKGILRITALLLIPAIIFDGTAFAADRPMSAAEIKSKLEARGVGHGVRITLKDLTEVKGVITSIGDDQCAVNVNKTNLPISYADVTGIHNDKMSTGKGVAIGVLLVFGGLLVVAFIAAVARGI